MLIDQQSASTYNMYLNSTCIQRYISILSTETLKGVVMATFGTGRSTDVSVRCPLNSQQRDNFKKLRNGT